MVLVLLFTLTIDQNVIKIENHKPTNVRPKHLVHKPHESARGVRKAEWHHNPLIQTPFGLECGLPLISLSKADLIVATSQVQFREHT